MILSFTKKRYPTISSRIKQATLASYKTDNLHTFALKETLDLIISLSNVEGIIIPTKKDIDSPHELTSYDLHYFILALKSHPKTRAIPILIESGLDNDFSKFISVKYGIIDNLSLLSADQSKFSRRHLQKLMNYGKARYPAKNGRHAIANRWGAYQLQNTLSILRSIDTTTHLRTQLCSLDVHLGCELTLRELTSSPQTNSLDYCRTLLQDIEELLARDNESPHRILVIEDELELGWQLAYEILFQIQNVHIDFCESKETFDTTYTSKVSNGEYSLILLDMRLNQESDPSDVHRYNIEKVSGIQVLQDIKTHDFNTPIIMTTASNKAWTLESASEYGANGFWSKESPLTYTSQEETIQNCQSLLETIKETLSWSLKVRHIIQKFTQCTDLIIQIHDHLQPKFTKSQKKKCEGVKDGLVKKKKYLQSLLHKPESKFIQQYTGTRQWEYPYLIVWSLQNDFLPIVSWSKGCSPKCLFTLDRQIGLGYTKAEKKTNEQLQYYRKCLNYFDKDESENIHILPMVSKSVSLLEVHQMCSLIDILLVAPDGTSRAEFVFNSERRWKKLRNKINIIHGRPAETTTITPDTIDELLSFYLELLEKTYQYVQKRDIYQSPTLT